MTSKYFELEIFNPRTETLRLLPPAIAQAASVGVAFSVVSAASRDTSTMSLVTLHVYDITNTQYDAANSAIQNLNRFTKDALGAGGIFHGAVEGNGYEWSYGYCDTGSGVYPCRPKGNTGYTYRESVALGVTALAPARVQGILHVLQTQWPGHQYELLSRNCNHFCAELCERLNVMAPPTWVNRFAGHADATVTAVNYARDQTNKAMAEISSACSNAWEGLMAAGRGSQQDLRAAGGDAKERAPANAEGGSAPNPESTGESTNSDSTTPDENRT